MKYRKKPVEIEALQYTGDNISEICKFMHKDINHVMFSGHVYIETLEGVMKVSKGDYIIKGVEGEFYPCAKSIFEKTYEVVKE